MPSDNAPLSFAVNAGETSALDITLFVNGPNQADMKAVITVPSSTFKMAGIGQTAAENDGSNAAHLNLSETKSSATPLAYGTDTEGYIIKLHGIVAVGGTGGTVHLQWAQNSSQATGTVVEANSFLIAHSSRRITVARLGQRTKGGPGRGLPSCFGSVGPRSPRYRRPYPRGAARGLPQTPAR